MSHEIIHVIPDTPLSVLELFQPTKQGIQEFAAKIINEVEEGRVSALRIKLLCKTLAEIADKIDRGTTSNQRNEADAFGEKPFMFQGAELHNTATYTSYDYSACGDRVRDNLAKIVGHAAEQLKQREELLKKITTTQTMVDDETGEVYTVNPPKKNQTFGVKVYLK